MASGSVIFGILLVILIWMIDRRRGTGAQAAEPKPIPLAWWTLGFGLGAIIALLLAMQLSHLRTGLLWQVSIVFSCAALVLGIQTLRRRERRWPVWAGLAAGLIPALFWVAFALGYLLGIGE